MEEVKEDTENYIEYNLMKEQGENVLYLKKGVLPHIFLCQKRRMPLPKERMAVVKMQRLTLVNEALSSEIAIKSSVSEPSQRSDHEVSPSTSHTNVCDQPGCSTSRIGCDDLQVELSTSHIEKTLHCDKAVQVNIKPNYRSKGVNALPPNKAVMADRGFKDLSCLLEAKRCTLIRPPSVSKSTPSTKNEVKLSKRIAALRIHVERNYRKHKKITER
ncbi:hypothetical protein HW555_012598 [Spodoptera exigua]|uniref:DDE Tnp4 domain-containing protein n=1 Tax=Spodoptera exigua TaxID=7107 RepID=A0A835KZG3_SPOEX|nr:hypothetical protein HW555_012598 [Spodoptera exigua]